MAKAKEKKVVFSAKKDQIKIGIIGIGMVGTPLMRWFLEKGWQRGKTLFCYDADPKKDYFDDINQARIIFICVPTPPAPDGSCNTSIVESVVSQLPDRENRRDWCIVIKSTIEPGTTSYLCEKYRERGCFLFNPEFLTEAQADIDFKRPDRQIVAAADEESRRWLNIVINLLPMATYNSPGFFQSEDGREKYHFHESHSTAAEFSKYGANIFGAIKVSTGNIFNNFCEALDIDYETVKELISHDRRIGGAWLDVNHGNYRGFGGFCFPKDLKALIVFGEKILRKLPSGEKKEVFSMALNVLKSVWDYNERLLKSQGLTVEKISLHDEEVEKKIKSRRRREKHA